MAAGPRMVARTRADIQEHDEEVVPGLPGPLPPGETILWQGVPQWGGIARRGLFLRSIAIYFALMAVLQGASLAADGVGVVDTVLGASLVMLVAALPIALLAGFAVLAARTSLYTITSRRIVFRVGVALPMTVQIPFALIDSAAVSRHPDGTGDILVTIAKPHRVSWIALWPHVRPLHLKQPQPMLRALPDADAAALVLSRALAAAADMPVQPLHGMVEPRGSADAAALA